ncbi:S-layer homology domain-containing protein [Paenibacillus dokdonensis]|uniref:S-layer homology domain-containing protein n=1 Tax=Paenibacillus dokdonensis TaxID=2567944 RepID=A0ABU6GRA8_9BACL|nr:S-layer homology domain-containing protein [Paenibacillus dokdonensis]MEC0242256.1 S-layer homology domain-containing protein [Paenibacillus dokdonensis]
MKIKNRLLTVLMASALIFGAFEGVSSAAQSTTLPFDDIAGSFAKKEITELVKEGVVDGTGNRKFEPKKNVTRAEFVTMADRLLKLAPVDADMPSFGDVSSKSWYYGWVEAAIQLGIVEGKSKTQFMPAARITRQEAAVLIVRALKVDPGTNTGGNLPYVDSGGVAPWAAPYVLAARTLGLMEGAGGKFRPTDTMTREETAAVLDRVLQDKVWSKAIHKTTNLGIQVGWQNGLTTSQFIEKIKRTNVNTLVPRWFFLENAQVPISNHADISLSTWAKQNNKKIWAMLGNHSDSALTHQILSDESKRKTVIQKLTSYVKTYGLSGINVDFENVSPEERLSLTAFISELGTSLRSAGAVLSIDVSPDLGTDWTEAFDYEALGRYTDYVVLMSYDEHWDGDPIAGSVSSLPWVESATNRLLSVVPASKTILALPYYTRDWTLQSVGDVSEELSLIQQGQRIRSVYYNRTWDAELGQYVVTYTRQGSQHRIWVEDGRSLGLKTMMAAKRGVAGFAYWYIGAETHDIWASLSNATRYASY